MKTRIKKYNETMTITKRCLLLSKRNPDTFFVSILLPALMMILFVALFGKLIHVEGMSYVNFIVPGILLQCIAQGSSSTAIMMNKDIVNGIMTRYSTLPIKRMSILNGHVMEAVVRGMITTILVFFVAILVGFRPSMDLIDVGVVLLLLVGVILTLSWFAVVIGIVATSAEGASSLSSIVIILPYLSSGFVPADTLPNVIRIFAEYQPMTPIIDTLRNALLGRPLEMNTFVIAILWCAGLTIAFYFVSRLLFSKRLSK